MRLSKAIEGYALTSRTENKTSKTLQIITHDMNTFVRWFIGVRVSELTDKNDAQLESITTDKIRAFLDHEQNRGVSAHTVHHEYRVLRAFLKWCVREELLVSDPTLKIRPPKLPDLLPKALEPEQITGLLKYLQKDRTVLGKRDELIIHMLLGTGLRASELLGLDVDSVFIESSYILVRQGKGRKDRVVPIEPLLNKELWKYINGWRSELASDRERALFVGRSGRRLKLHGLQAMCHKHLGEFDVSGSVHIFRHTFASIYLRNGGNIETLRRILGHTSTEVTVRYISLLPNDLVNQQMQVRPLESVRF